MLLFVALVFWVFSRRRNEDFDAAARLPLDDDSLDETRDTAERD
jgi:cbb3-type cytochrome oxidase subunit 3